MKKISGTKISIPHSAMLKLKQQGILNLGMVNDVAVRIANNSGLTPKDKGTYRAMHFWSWVSVGQFLYSISNPKINKTILMERDKEFYEKVRKLNGWDYEVNEETAKKYRKK